MATLSQARKAEIAAELRTASTWVGGPRRTALLALAAEIAGDEPDTPDPTPTPPADKGKGPTASAT